MNWHKGLQVSGQGLSIYVQDERGRVIASVGSHDMRRAGIVEQFIVKDHDEIQKLARLVAAAPDLLKAARDLLAVADVDYYGSDWTVTSWLEEEPTVQKLREALAPFEGG